MKNPAASLGNTGVPCRISVTYRPIQELKPDPTNPRRHKQEAVPPSAPAGAKNLKTLLSEALNACVIVSDNGGRRKITKREAIITQLVNRSATADWRAIKIVFNLVRDIEGQTEPASPETSAFSEADEKVIEQLRARFSKPEK